MAICSFYQMGRCKFGARCKNEHPGEVTQANRSGGFDNSGGKASSIFSNLSADDIRLDLTPGKGRPEWIFSCYAPVRNTPVHLFGGPAREQSFEEMRVMHYAAQAAGNAEQAVQDANRLYAESEAQMQTILNNTEAAVRYIVDGSNQHPNRLDVLEGMVAPVAPAPVPAPATTAPNPFGQNQQPPQQQANPFNQGQIGQSAFGQPSVFGQPSGMAQQQQSAFGRPAFGQPSFGQPSLGQPPAAQPAFGQPSFGQPSPFAQIAGGAQQQTQPNPFQQQPFGQAPQQPNPFGGQQPSAPAPAPAPFAQQQQPNPFGQPSGPTTGGFGTATNAAGGPFANAQPPPSTGPNPLLKAASSTAPEGGKPPKFTDIPSNLDPNLVLTGETIRDPMTNRLILWKGQPVRYFNGEPRYQHPNNAQVFMHIFFPDGPPPIEAMGDVQGKSEDYNPEIEEIYKQAKQARRFTTKVPIVPPKAEWCSFDL